MALNVCTAVIGSGCNTATASPSLAQWDQGQVLKIEGVDLPAAYQVEFSTEYTRNAIQKIGNANGVAVPNELLQRSAPITAYVVLHEGENDRETEYWITIHITPRTPPETITPDPEQADIIDEAIAALNNGVAAAEAAAESVQNMGAEAETLAPGSPLTVTKEVDPETGAVTLIFGLTQGPKGDNGYSPTITITEIPGGHRFTVTDAIHPSGQSFDVLDGTKGDQGDDGYSPVVTITTITGGHRFTVTDKAHPSGQSFDVLDGAKGDQGDDGYSPVVTITTITGGHRVTITDKTHPSGQSFDVMDGVIQSVNGKSAAAITLDSGDIEFDDSVTYAAGSIGAEVSDAKNAIGQLDDTVNDPKHGLAQKAPLIINSASGDIASFPDGADDMPIKKLVGTIEPVQSGTGDPSPDNVRPISGWTGANISQSPYTQTDKHTITGKNLYNAPSNAVTVLVPCHIDNGVSVVVSAKSGGNSGVRYYNASKTLIDYWTLSQYNIRTGRNYKQFAASGGIEYIEVYGGNPTDIMVETGVTVPSDYEPYGRGIPVTFPTTIYGGSDEVIGGALVSDLALATFNGASSESWVDDVSGGYHRFRIQINDSIYVTDRVAKIPACNIAKYANGSNVEWSAFVFNRYYYVVPSQDITTVAAWKEFLANTPLQIAYKLDTPTEYTLTPQELTTLYGVNNIWTDVGEVSVDYPADTKLYIDNKIATAIANALNA